AVLHGIASYPRRRRAAIGILVRIKILRIDGKAGGLNVLGIDPGILQHRDKTRHASRIGVERFARGLALGGDAGGDGSRVGCRNDFALALNGNARSSRSIVGEGGKTGCRNGCDEGGKQESTHKNLLNQQYAGWWTANTS